MIKVFKTFGLAIADIATAFLQLGALLRLLLRQSADAVVKVSEGWLVNHEQQTIWTEYSNRTLRCQVQEASKNKAMGQSILISGNHQLQTARCGITRSKTNRVQ